MTVVRRNGVTWTADRTGLAHADPDDKTFRALCGARPTAPRFAWPIRDWCRVCLALEAGRAATTEQDRVVALAKADPEYRQMLMDDADLAAKQEAEGAA